MTWRVEFTPKAEKALRAVPEGDRARILFKVWELKLDPRPPGCRKIRGSEYWRIRQGDWRVIYAVEDEVCRVLVLHVLRRNESTYGGLH